MDSKTLPQKQPAVKTYKHFTINADVHKETTSGQKIEFFYLGKDSGKINLLINIFESGYSAESVENAISVLTRINERQKIPDVIIVDAAMGESAIKELHHYISGVSNFNAVPFMLEVSDMPESDFRKFKRLLFLDEIFSLDDQDAKKLVSKIGFIKGIKKRRFGYQNGEHLQNFEDTIFDSKIIIKRLFDIIISLLAIIILSPVLLMIALAIKIESRGPVLYVSLRAGRGYKVFNFFKFRTMVNGADEKIEELSHLNHYFANDENSPVFFKVFNDSRITRIGAFLRNTSMDELPQFFNVLLGDMSLVGNRPLPLYEAAQLTTNDWSERFMAPAGITGLWQIKKKRQGEMSMEDRINLDIAYSHKYNFMYDLWIIANTPSALIQKPNA